MHRVELFSDSFGPFSDDSHSESSDELPNERRRSMFRCYRSTTLQCVVVDLDRHVVCVCVHVIGQS
jgi:hypothetical protein